MANSWQDSLANGFDTSGNLKVSLQSSIDSWVGTISIPLSETVTSGTLTSGFNGLMRHITITTPAMEVTGTATVNILDAAGGTLYTQAQDEGLTTTYGSIVPVLTTMKFVAVANGTQSAARSIVVRAYYER